jgi:hypothetical protein
MARTPTISTPFSERQVEPGILGGGNFETSAPSAAFSESGQTDKALGGLNNELRQRALEQKKMADELVIDQAKNQALTSLNTFKSQMETAKLGDALQYSPSVKGGKYQEFMGAIKDNLPKMATNETQKREIDGFVRGFETHVSGLAQMHVAEQSQKYAIASKSALTETLANQYISSGGKDEVTYKSYLDEKSKQAIMMGIQEGTPLYEKYMMDSRGVAVGGVVNYLGSNGQSIKGLDYLKAHEKDIDPIRYDEIKKQLHTSLITDLSQEQFDKSKGKHTYADGQIGYGIEAEAKNVPEEYRADVAKRLKSLAEADNVQRRQMTVENERAYESKVLDGATRYTHGDPSKDFNWAVRQIPQHLDNVEKMHRIQLAEKAYGITNGKKTDESPSTLAQMRTAIWDNKVTPGTIDETDMGRTNKIDLYDYSNKKLMGKGLDEATEQVYADYWKRGSVILANDPTALNTFAALLEKGRKEAYGQGKVNMKDYAETALKSVTSQHKSYKEWEAILSGSPVKQNEFEQTDRDLSHPTDIQ